MRISDWSSDVCSSDLGDRRGRLAESLCHIRSFLVLVAGSGAEQERVSAALARTRHGGQALKQRQVLLVFQQVAGHQGQVDKFSTLRDMINWCIDKPNQGEDRKSTRLNSSH